MVRRSEFKVQAPRRKPDLVERPRRKAPPSIMVTHKVLGPGRLVGLRPSGSGGFVCDVKFGSVMRTLKLDEAYFATPVADIIALAPNFPAPKPKAEPREKKRADDDEEIEPETEELDATHAFYGDSDGEESSEAEAADAQEARNLEVQE